MPNNKVKYNLKNAHYALLNIAQDGTISYGNPVPIPGAVSIGLDANGEPENFYADGIAYYVINNNMGYDGDLELVLIPESFRIDVLRETLDENAGVAITVNGNSISSGSSAAWAEGENHVVITVTNAGSSKRYTVTVTKEE